MIKCCRSLTLLLSQAPAGDATIVPGAAVVSPAAPEPVDSATTVPGEGFETLIQHDFNTMGKLAVSQYHAL